MTPKTVFFGFGTPHMSSSRQPMLALHYDTTLEWSVCEALMRNTGYSKSQKNFGGIICRTHIGEIRETSIFNTKL